MNEGYSMICRIISSEISEARSRYCALISSSFVRIIVWAITVVSLPTSTATTTSAITTHITHLNSHIHQIHYLSAIIVITPAITAIHIVVRIHKGFRILREYAENANSYGKVEFFFCWMRMSFASEEHTIRVCA